MNVRRLVVTGLAAVILAAPTAARADSSDYGNERGNCNREGNCNDQRRCQGNNCTDNHKSFSPDLKDSPVTICMPGSTCYFDGKKDPNQPPKGGGQGQDPQPGETPRTVQPNPACLISVPYHCDPAPR